MCAHCQFSPGEFFIDQGNPILDDGVLIHVIGSLKNNGQVFFNTRKLRNPWKTKLQSDELPVALDIAIRTMKKHEIARVSCRPEYCYGNGKQFLVQLQTFQHQRLIVSFSIFLISEY